MAYSERELIARMIQCEAGGEGDNGMKAVASVIMNRVNVPNGEYARISQGGNIRNILFQQGQFDCARETIRGSYNSQIVLVETYYFNKDNLTVQEKLYVEAITVKLSLLKHIISTRTI